jgi:integrase
MKQVVITDLVALANEAVKPIHHSASTIYQYNLSWSCLMQYFKKSGETYYSKQRAMNFIKKVGAEYKKGNIKIWRFKLHRLSVHILNEVFDTGEYTWKFHGKNPNEDLAGTYRAIQEAYERKLMEQGKGVGTIDCCNAVSRYFLKYVQDMPQIDIKNLALKTISEFIPCLAKRYKNTSMRTALSALRTFLKYLYREGVIIKNLLPAVPSSGARKYSVIPALKKEDEVKIINTIDRSTVIGKRNYAMVLLAMRNGLREIDILNLRKTDIDWYKNTISLIQHKTGKPLILPLLPEVGNAIADYLLHGRPSSDLPFIFLSNTVPHRTLRNGYMISRKIMEKAGVRQSGEGNNGFHVYRHSLASKLLASGAPISVIATTLGHSNTGSSKVYLSTDAEHLKACALDLTGIESGTEAGL